MPAQPSQTHAAESLGETLRETLGGRKLTWPSGARALGDCHSGGVMMEGKEGDVLVVNASQLMPTLVGQRRGPYVKGLPRTGAAHCKPPLLVGPIVLVDWLLARRCKSLSFRHPLGSSRRNLHCMHTVRQYSNRRSQYFFATGRFLTLQHGGPAWPPPEPVIQTTLLDISLRQISVPFCQMVCRPASLLLWPRGEERKSKDG